MPSHGKDETSSVLECRITLIAGKGPLAVHCEFEEGPRLEG